MIWITLYYMIAVMWTLVYVIAGIALTAVGFKKSGKLKTAGLTEWIVGIMYMPAICTMTVIMDNLTKDENK